MIGPWCPYEYVLGHAVDPEEWRPRRCTRLRFHISAHEFGPDCATTVPRWWLWDYPWMRCRRLFWRFRAVVSRAVRSRR